MQLVSFPCFFLLVLVKLLIQSSKYLYNIDDLNMHRKKFKEQAKKYKIKTL